MVCPSGGVTPGGALGSTGVGGRSGTTSPLAGPAGVRPTLTSKLSEKSWIFCWDARRGVGYLLVTPQSRKQDLRFQVSWEQ